MKEAALDSPQKLFDLFDKVSKLAAAFESAYYRFAKTPIAHVKIGGGRTEYTRPKPHSDIYGKFFTGYLQDGNIHFYHEKGMCFLKHSKNSYSFLDSISHKLLTTSTNNVGKFAFELWLEMSTAEHKSMYAIVAEDYYAKAKYKRIEFELEKEKDLERINHSVFLLCIDWWNITQPGSNGNKTLRKKWAKKGEDKC